MPRLIFLADIERYHPTYLRKTIPEIVSVNPMSLCLLESLEAGTNLKFPETMPLIR